MIGAVAPHRNFSSISPEHGAGVGSFITAAIVLTGGRGPHANLQVGFSNNLDHVTLDFEANPSVAMKLKVRYQRDLRVQIIAKGLYDKGGRHTLYVPCYKGFVYDALASFDRNSAAGWINDRTVFWFDPDHLSITELECQVSTLDAQQAAPSFIPPRQKMLMEAPSLVILTCR